MNYIENIVESLMYFISYIEIIYNIYIKNIIQNIFTSCYSMSNILIINNNKINKSISFNSYNKDMLNDNDFAIFEYFKDDKKCHYYLEKDDDFNCDNIINESKKMFIAAEICKNNNEIINIDLNEINYFFVNNKLFKEKYIHFYMNYNNISISDYIINLVDNECNIVKLQSNQYILLQSDSYEIKN